MEKLRNDLILAFHEVAIECADKIDDKNISEEEMLFFANMVLIFRKLGNDLQ